MSQSTRMSPTHKACNTARALRGRTHTCTRTHTHGTVGERGRNPEWDGRSDRLETGRPAVLAGTLSQENPRLVKFRQFVFAHALFLFLEKLNFSFSLYCFFDLLIWFGNGSTERAGGRAGGPVWPRHLRLTDQNHLFIEHRQREWGKGNIPREQTSHF